MPLRRERVDEPFCRLSTWSTSRVDVLVAAQQRRYKYWLWGAVSKGELMAPEDKPAAPLVKHLEDWLAPLAKEQAAKGNVTVADRYSEFDSRYRFFRGLPDRSCGPTTHGRIVTPKTKDEPSAIFGDLPRAGIR
jgi:hypothetical protein